MLRTTGLARDTVGFRTRAGLLTARADGDGTTTLDFPAAPLTPVSAPEGLARALGADPLTVLDTGPDCGDLLVEVADEATVRALAPDFAALARLVGPRGGRDRGGRGPARRLRLRLARLLPGRRHRRGPGDGQRAHRARAVLVGAAGLRRADRPPGVGPYRTGAHPAAAATGYC